MSTRKPKAIVIRDEEPIDTEEPSKAESKLAKDKKSAFTTKRKIKIQPPAQNEDDLDDEELGSIKLNLRKPKNKTSLSIPLFNEFEEPSQRSLDIESIYSTKKVQNQEEAVKDKVKKVQFSTTRTNTEEKEDSPRILTLNEDYSMEPIIKSRKEPEYIALDFEEGPTKVKSEEGDDDDGFFDQDQDMLDDGRLALTERENNIQKRMSEMNIEEAIYEAEISPDEELEDWEASRMNQGILNAEKGINIRKPPRFNLASNDTLSTEIEKLQASVVSLSEHRLKVQNQLDSALRRKEKTKESMNRLITKIGDLK